MSNIKYPYVVAVVATFITTSIIILTLGVPLASALLGLVFYIPILAPWWFPEHTAQAALKFETYTVVQRFSVLATVVLVLCGLLYASPVVIVGILLLGCLIYASTCDSEGWKTYHRLRAEVPPVEPTPVQPDTTTPGSSAE